MPLSNTTYYSRYYRAAGYKETANKELAMGDVEFEKFCSLSGLSAEYCTGVRRRILDFHSIANQ